MTTPNETDSVEWANLAPWERFHSDLILSVHHVLTEPTCPTATVSFEIPERAGKHVLSACTGDSVEEAIHRALQSAKKKLEEMNEDNNSDVGDT